MPRKAVPAVPPLPQPAVPVHIRLQQLRIDHHLSQMTLARLTGLNQCTISRLETGAIQFPHGRTLQRLGQVYGLSEDQLRRVLGMYTPPPAPLLDGAPRCSEAALQLAHAFDQLAPSQQAYLTALIETWRLAEATGAPPLEVQP